MIGPKKLQAIRQELRRLLKKGDKELQEWLDQRPSSKRPKGAVNTKVEEDLLWVRKVLEEAAAGKRYRGKRRSSRSKAKNKNPSGSDNDGMVDWLLACPEKGWFKPIASESTKSL